MRKILLGIILPLILVIAIGAGVWWIARLRAANMPATPAPSSSQTGGTGSGGTREADVSETAELPKSVKAEELHYPTDAERAKWAGEEQEGVLLEDWKPGDPTTTTIPAYTLVEAGASPTTPSTAPADDDEDGDGLTTAQERQYGTSPTRADTDGDGLTDGDEVMKYGTRAITVDTDGDGLNDGEEVIRWYTDPTKADTDGDGYSDGQEVAGGYNPNGPGRL